MINIWRMRTNRETSTWLRKISAQRLTMRENSEEAKEFFGGFSGDHRTFVSWNKDFLQKERKNEERSPRKIDGRRGWDRSVQWDATKQLLSICGKIQIHF